MFSLVILSAPVGGRIGEAEHVPFSPVAIHPDVDPCDARVAIEPRVKGLEQLPGAIDEVGVASIGDLRVVRTVAVIVMPEAFGHQGDRIVRDAKP